MLDPPPGRARDRLGHREVAAPGDAADPALTDLPPQQVRDPLRGRRGIHVGNRNVVVVFEHADDLRDGHRGTSAEQHAEYGASERDVANDAARWDGARWEVW